MSYRLFKRGCALLHAIFIALALFTNVQAAGEVDPTFNPALVDVRNRNGLDQAAVNRIAVQSDGKILIAGSFETADKFAKCGIARLNANGTVDDSFEPPIFRYNPGGIGTLELCKNIRAVTLQTDGKILVGGDFATVNGLARPGIARLNADGSLDNSFNVLSNAGASFSGFTFIYDIKVSADGKITFAGRFILNSSGTRQNIARVFADGTPDTSFNPSSVIANSSTVVYRIEPLSDAKTLVAGLGGGINGGFVYRLNGDGSVDTTFATVATSTPNNGCCAPAVRALRVLPDGKFLIGGGFAEVNGFPLRRLARINEDGSIDTSFNITSAGPNFEIYDLEVTASGMILVGGNFSTYNGASRNSLALLDANGNLDNSFIYTGTPRQVNDVAILPDGKFFIGTLVAQGTFLPPLIRLNADGSTDSTFSLLFGSYARSYKVFVQSDGKILIGGFFNHIDNQNRTNLARVNADGTLDTTFTSQFFNNEVYGIDVRADGKILISTATGVTRLNANGTTDRGVSAGAAYDAKFLSGGGAIAASAAGGFRLRRVSETGVLDPSLDVIVNAAIRKILIQPDGKFIIAGEFIQAAGVTRGRIARVNADGTLDTTFNPPGGANNNIFDIALQTDGKIIIGGNFTAVNFNTNYKNLARLNSDGSLDTSFNPIIEGGVQSLKIQPNGKILVGGAMYLVNGAARNGIARLNADGSLDESFNPGAGADDSVLSIDLQTNGNIIIGGFFRHVNNVDRLGVARLLDVASPRTRFDFDGDGRADVAVFRPSTGSWYILRSQNNSFAAVQFGQQSDQIAPADYDGDGRTDVAVFRGTVAGAGNLAYFYILNSSNNSFIPVQFGATGDVPVTGDWDGDGRADLAVYRDGALTGGQSNFYYRPSSQPGANFRAIQWGASGDKPLVGDFDGDGKLDAAVFRPSTATWYILRSSNNNVIQTTFGLSTDIPVPADYGGDGLANIAVFRPSTGTWFTSTNPATNYGSIQFGASGDVPVPADYDGDGRTDVAVYRPSAGAWYLSRSTSGFAGVAFGSAEDKPIPNAYIR